MGMIYFIIMLLIFAEIFWIWNSTKELEDVRIRISFVLIGTIFIAIITLLLFEVSKIGVLYPKQEMIGQVRKIMLLVFVPINSFIILSQVSTLIARVKNGELSKEEQQKKTRFILIVFAIMIILECIYFKNIQSGIIGYINNLANK